jgi:hypothetical protein
MRERVDARLGETAHAGFVDVRGSWRRLGSVARVGLDGRSVGVASVCGP